ncbi:MAG: polysialyltransferase family glycosyltransferase [bacterium]|nr:polysialyltransferase family glycosyltransferase [bacterium]
MQNIILSASDPGGANTLLPLIEQLSKEFKLHFILGGASRELFTKAGIDFVDGDKLGEVELQKIITDLHPDIFVAGSSFGYTIDKRILELVKGKTKTIYILDFWSNYWQRFSSLKVKDFKYLPDVICVMDDFASKEMIKDGFVQEMIRVTGNPHFDSFIESISPELREKNRILFISQPYSDTENVATNFGYTEFDVLDDLLEILEDHNDYKLIIRPHPKEEQGKFNEVIKSRKNISLDDDTTDVRTSISRADLIIGMNSMVLLQAGLAGKDVISYQPGLKDGTDVLVSNKMGMSRLVTDSEELRQILGNYFTGSGVNIRNKADLKGFSIIKNAGDNVIKLIKNYVKV